MGTLGEIDIQVSTRIIGKLSIRNVYAEPAIYPCLGITLGCTLRNITESVISGDEPIVDYWLMDLSGELRFTEHRESIGSVVWKGKRHGITSSPHNSEHQVKLVCDLDHWRLEKIEQRREGKPMTLWLQLWPTLMSKNELLDVKAGPMRMDIPRDLWIDFLSKVNHGQIEIIEVQFDPQEAERFQNALKYTKVARENITKGQYDEAVAVARKALEALSQDLNEGSKSEDILRAAMVSSTDEKRAKEYLGIISRIKQLTALAHHATGVIYSRVEAQFIVRTTENLIVLVAGVIRTE